MMLCIVDVIACFQPTEKLNYPEHDHTQALLPAASETLRVLVLGMADQ